MFEELMEELVQYFSKDPYKNDFNRAKEIYVKTFGSVVEEHPYFDSWISGFFQWYLIDYKMIKLGVPPIFLYQKIFTKKLSKEELEYLLELERSELVFIEIGSVSGQKIKGANPFTKKTVEFYSHENTALVVKGDYIISRIYSDGSKTQSFGVMWHFNSEIQPIFMKKMVQVKTQMDQEFLLYELIKKKTQSEVYSHVPLDQIFGWKTSETRIHMETKET